MVICQERGANYLYVIQLLPLPSVNLLPVIYFRGCMLHESETWPVRKENKVTLQRAEMRVVRWMCDVKVKDRVQVKSRERD